MTAEPPPPAADDTTVAGEEEGGDPLGPGDAGWVEDRTGAVVNTAFIAAALSIAGRPPLRDAAALVRKIVGEPSIATGPLSAVAVESGRILAGQSELEPWRRDRRYGDPAWRTNPFLRGMAQLHAAFARALPEIVDAARLEPIAGYRLRLAATNVAEALSPANVPLLNPSSLKAAVDTGGASLLRGTARFMHDMRRPPRLPLRSDPDDFELGVELAATVGGIVERMALHELIQYRERRRQLHLEPVLVVPSVVNKYYLTDMSPGRSLVEHMVANGWQTFSLSWVNPDETYRQNGLDDYVASVLAAVDTVRSITGAERVHILGVCAGGQLAALALARLAAANRGLQRIGSLTLLVCALDYSASDLPQRLLNDESAGVALRPVMSRGYVDGRHMTAALAWLRPTDSVWWPFTQRYLVGADMPKLDLFAWSEDVTNLPAAFVRDQLELTRSNALVHPGALTVLGEPVELRRVDVDAYIVAGRTDHLTPWESCYRATELLASRSRFVLVDGGHIQSLLRPPAERVVPFFHGEGGRVGAEEWLEGADIARRSWWDDWLDWLAERSPGVRQMRRKLGNSAYPVIEPAPGSYVRRRLDRP